MTPTFLSRRARFTSGLLVLLVALASVAYGEPHAKLDRLLAARALQPSGRSRVIVEFRGAPDVRVITAMRGVVGRRLEALQSQVAEVDNWTLTAMASDPRVSRIVADRATFPTLERTAVATGARAARAEFGLTGRGVAVAVIDSGITAWHDDLYLAAGSSSGNRIVAFKDFTDGSDHPEDPYGHGTHVAGIIAGNGFDSDGRRTGLAPDAQLVGLKVLDGDGHGYISDVIAALDYAVSVKDTYRIRVINLSVAAAVTESYLTDPLTRAALRAVDAGLVVVAAAGNLGQSRTGKTVYGSITAPGNAPWVLTVGAASHQGTTGRADDVIAAFSSRGPTRIDLAAKPDLIAYGVGIESLSDPNSTLYAARPGMLLDGTHSTWYRPYMSMSGTSMAAPVVSGAIALMLEANPALTPNAVKAILEYTAEARAGQPLLAQGAGLLNVRGAVRLARYFAIPHSDVGSAGDTIAGRWVAWSRQVIWGNTRIAGGQLLPDASAWTAAVTWGDRTTEGGAPVTWGVAADDQNIIWSTATADDSNIIWSTAAQDDSNIIWSTGAEGDSNIIWSTGATGDVVWSAPAVNEQRRQFTSGR